MQDLAVAAILLAICVMLIVSAVAVCRLMGIWKFGGAKNPQSDEKAVLTKTEQHPGYKVTGEENVHMAMGTEYSVSNETKHCPDETSPDQESKDIGSPDSISIASDYEPTGGLHRAVSCESVDSTSSVMELEPEAPKIGQLEFGLEYDREVSELVISVIQAKALEENEATGTQDSFVKLWIAPSRQTPKSQTKLQKNTTEPVYKERFLYSIEPDELDRKTANFQVFSCDKYARQKLLGECDLKIGDIDLRQPIRVWMNLRDMDERVTELGDIMFSLSYLPTAERLTVVVVKCRTLKWLTGKDTGDCFVKVYLLQNGKKISKKKTSTKKDQKNPIFNEAIIFSVPASALSGIQLRISVVENQPPDGKLTSIGHVIVGSQVTGTELTHWNQMMSSLRRPVAMWHPIRK